MIRKAVVLFGVQHLEKGAGRVPVIGGIELVHLVQHHHRVRDAAFLNAVHDAAGHGPDIGAPMAADIRLVAHAAQADTHILALQGTGDAAADAGLAGAGGPDKEQNGAGLFALEIHDGNLFHDPALDLLQAVMVLFQHLARLIQVDDLGLGLLPVQRGDKVEVIIEHAVFGRLAALLLQTVEDLDGLGTRRLVHAGFLDLHLEFADIRDLFGMHVVELALEIFQLLFDGRFLIDVLIFLLVGGVGIVGHLGDLKELINQLFHQLGPPAAAVLGEDLIILLIGGRHPDGKHARQRPQGLHLIDEGHGSGPPLIALGEFPDGVPGLTHLFLRFLVRQVTDVAAAAGHQGNGPVAVDHHALDIHAPAGAHNGIAVIADLGNRAGEADGIKAVLTALGTRLVLFGNEQNNLLIHIDIACKIAELIPAEIDIRIRGNQLVVYRNNCHKTSSSMIIDCIVIQYTVFLLAFMKFLLIVLYKSDFSLCQLQAYERVFFLSLFVYKSFILCLCFEVESGISV